MKLHPPFIITPRLLPGLRLGDGCLSLERIDHYATHDGRDVAHMVIDLPGQASYHDATLKSGCGGFRSTVEVFESYLGFLEAALESYRYGGDPDDPDSNASLFPKFLLDELDRDDVTVLRLSLCEDETDRPLHHLIEEEA